MHTIHTYMHTYIIILNKKKESRAICKKFMHEPMEIYVDDEKKLTLEGLLQHFVKLEEKDKIGKLVDLLDTLEFNQVCMYVLFMCLRHVCIFVRVCVRVYVYFCNTIRYVCVFVCMFAFMHAYVCVCVCNTILYPPLS